MLLYIQIQSCDESTIALTLYIIQYYGDAPTKTSTVIHLMYANCSTNPIQIYMLHAFTLNPINTRQLLYCRRKGHIIRSHISQRLLTNMH